MAATIDRIPVKTLVDLRLEGNSFSQMALRFDSPEINKNIIYQYYMQKAVSGFDGYEPLSVKRLRRLLSYSYLTIEDIANMEGVSYRGLINYMHDYGIARRIDDDGLFLLAKMKKSKRFVARFYGVSTSTIDKYLSRNHLELDF